MSVVHHRVLANRMKSKPDRRHTWYLTHTPHHRVLETHSVLSRCLGVGVCLCVCICVLMCVFVCVKMYMNTLALWFTRTCVTARALANICYWRKWEGLHRYGCEHFITIFHSFLLHLNTGVCVLNINDWSFMWSQWRRIRRIVSQDAKTGSNVWLLRFLDQLIQFKDLSDVFCILKHLIVLRFVLIFCSLVVFSRLSCFVPLSDVVIVSWLSLFSLCTKALKYGNNVCREMCDSRQQVQYSECFVIDFLWRMSM